MKSFIITLSFIILGLQASTQGILFRSFDLRASIQVAQIEDKNIFVDTYTPWCVPCKKMEVIFKNRELGRYLNKHYLNVKFNMAEEIGDPLKIRYDVLFLPTLLILDKFGNVLYKHEGMLNADELLALAKKYNEIEAIVEVPEAQSSIKSVKLIEPEEKVIAPEIKSSENEKILFQAGQESTEQNPRFLYKFAYLQMSLQDTTQYKIAQDYLNTQEDWNTEENIKFIFDFLHDVHSPLFLYMIDHLPVFHKFIGEDKVNHTIQILVNEELKSMDDNASINELIELFSYESPDSSMIKAYQYKLDFYKKNNNHQAIAELGITYLQSSTNIHDELISQFTTAAIQCSCQRRKMIQELENHAAKNEVVVLKKLALLYADLGEKRRAIRFIDKAIKNAEDKMMNKEEILEIKRFIEANKK